MNKHLCWKNILDEEFSQPYFQSLNTFLEKEYNEEIVYPPKPAIFHALYSTPISNLKVVILGQDPYHGPNQAHGLAFSVLKGNPIPPSLKNIYKELASDISGFITPNHGFLEYWASQGILLLNTTLTVRKGQPGSHQKKGWEIFTDNLIKRISTDLNGVIFLLWGKTAINKNTLIDLEKHHVLTAPHPSPLSAYSGFFGCKHFSKTNELLHNQGKKPIDWQIPLEKNNWELF